MEVLLLTVFFYFLDQFFVGCIFQQIYFHSVCFASFQIFAVILPCFPCLLIKCPFIKIDTAPHRFLVYTCHNMINSPIAFSIFCHICIPTIDDDRFFLCHNVLQNRCKTLKNTFARSIIIYITIVYKKTVNTFFK